MFYKSLNGKCQFHIVASCIVMAGFSSVSSLDADTILYNGIQLPDQWPPRTGNPNSLEPMVVPYLINPPQVIPINVGRQLFVDNFLIESTDMQRVYHQAVKYEHNPVFKPEYASELKRLGVVHLGQGGIFYDPREKVFKMFYTAGWRGPFSLATSSDLINWTRPQMMSCNSNVLIPQSVDDHSCWLDINAVDPDQRIKYNEYDRDQKRHIPYTSADGYKWSKGIAVDSTSDDYSSFFYNPFRQVWVYSIRQREIHSIRGREILGRNRYYHECPDFLKGFNWSNSVYWTNTDSLDKPEPMEGYPNAGEVPQLYSLNAVAYESLMVGMHYIWRGPNNKIIEEGKFPKLIDLELGFSRDGFHWYRPADRKPFIAGTRQDGDWDRAYLHSTTGVFVIYDDKLVFPYSGFSGIAPDGSRHHYAGASIGIASLRRDGFASMNGAGKTRTLTTRAVKFDGSYLFVNVDCPKGELYIEVLDENGKVIAPFSKDNCKPICIDSTKQLLEWKTANDLSKLRNMPVKFRFYLTNGNLYSFWVSSNSSGASNGYVGAGGPDYDGVMDK